MDVKDSVEATGEDVEAAVAAGLNELGVDVNDVLVEVLEEPSRGVFGIGARQARVRLKLLRPPSPAVEVDDSGDHDDDYEDTDEDLILVQEIEDATEIAEDGLIGKQVLSELLLHMELPADIVVRRAEQTQPEENSPWILDIQGSDLNQLVGRRGETLGALQYITRLITSRQIQRRANIVVDAGGYKTRRSQRLRQLALRMADQAVQQQRTVYLEPMPPNERRIIHITLRERKDVHTKSTGEGDSRKVTIIPA